MAVPTTEIFLRSPYWITQNEGEDTGGVHQVSVISVDEVALYENEYFFIYLNGVRHTIETKTIRLDQVSAINEYISNLPDYTTFVDILDRVFVTAVFSGVQEETYFEAGSSTGLDLIISTPTAGVTPTNDNALGKVLCDLRVWTGEMTDEPSYPSIKLRSTALNGTTSIDIAEFARDYVEVTYNGGSASDAVFISYELTIFNEFSNTPHLKDRVYLTGLDGYSMFQDEVNYITYQNVMMSDKDVTAYCNSNMRIPVLTKYLTGYKLRRYVGPAGKFENMTTFHEVTGLEAPTSTDEIVKYISSMYQNTAADLMTFQFSQGPDEEVSIDYAPLTKYGVSRIWFVNRFGCQQEMHLLGRSDVSLTGKAKDYKRNLLVNGGYNNQRHQTHILNKNGKMSIELNTGWRNQEENDTIIEMTMSEQIWLTVDRETVGRSFSAKSQVEYTIPVNLQSEDTKLMTRLNDKLINYTFKFDAAFDLLNNVR